jgi:hypothetical protein
VTVRVSVAITLDDYIAANVLYQRRYWIFSGLLKAYGLGAVAFFLLMLVFTAIDEQLTWQSVLAGLLASLGFGFLMPVLIPVVSLVKMRLSVKRQFEQLSLGLPIEYEIDSNGLRAANEQGTATLTWDLFHDFVQDRRLLLLRRARRMFFILPKAQLGSEQLETILACVREAGVKEG